MKKIVFAVIASAAAMASVSAFAQDPNTWYAGAGVTDNHYKFDVPNATSPDNRSGYAAAGKFFGGYNIDKMWGVEAGYTDFGSNGYNYTDATTGRAGSITSSSHAFYVAGKGTYSVTDQVSVFGKLGVARSHDSIDGTGIASGITGQNKNGLYASVGGEYAINKKISLIAEYEKLGQTPDQGRKSAAFSLSAKYNF
ncbi:MAG TPA: outer membrane beta-barrel protein [Janthinobacterium sp.]|jgi:OOP family OmpA-OmpF porin|nr:outer membrane beta-barrel protein [Janthinobacterium sp.]